MMQSNKIKLRKFLLKMGFNEYEITPFIKDILQYNTQQNCRSKIELNAEMESLGWGINVIDEAVFKKINLLTKR